MATSETIDKFADISGKITPQTRLGAQDPTTPTRTEAATVQAIVDKGLEAHAFEPADPALQMHLANTANPHQVTPAEIGSPTQTDLSDHVSDTANPHQVNADEVGRGSAQWNADRIQDVPVAAGTPASGQALIYDGSVYKPGNVAADLPGYLNFVAQDAANMQANTLFLDSATGKLSYKDNAGITHLVPMGNLGANQAPYTDDNGLLTGLDMVASNNQVVVIAPDGKALHGIPVSKAEIPVAWIVYDDSEDVSPVVGIQPLPIPMSPLNGYQFVDVMLTCAVKATGSVSVEILKNGVSMMDTPITLTDADWVDMASDSNAEIKDPPDSIVSRGDAVTYSVTSVTGSEPMGLSIAIVLRAV